QYIINALSPAEIKEVILDDAEHSALIKVEDDQLSLAIGRSGQNVRLASKLTGWNIEVEKNGLVMNSQDESSSDTEESETPTEEVATESAEADMMEEKPEVTEEQPAETEELEEVNDSEAEGESESDTESGTEEEESN